MLLIHTFGGLTLPAVQRLDGNNFRAAIRFSVRAPTDLTCAALGIIRDALLPGFWRSLISFWSIDIYDSLPARFLRLRRFGVVNFPRADVVTDWNLTMRQSINAVPATANPGIIHARHWDDERRGL